MEKMSFKERPDLKKTVEFLNFYNVLTDFLQIWGNNNIGNVEIDVVKVSEYLLSGKWMVDGFGLDTKEDMYIYVENQVLNGMPIWEFFIISDWTRNMLEKSFRQEIKIVHEEMYEKYACMTCILYSVKETEYGILQRCNKPRDKLLSRRESFQLIEVGKCKYYDDKRLV